tara:strand:+ start:8349 stop:9926 length:1578 start_codon:yes stop_codon:yes gene_type:complete
MSDEDVERMGGVSDNDPDPPVVDSETDQPSDHFHLTFIIFFLAGIGTLLPWNVFITERGYFDEKLRVDPYPGYIVNQFESVFGMTFMTANVIGLVLLVNKDSLSKVPRACRVPIPLFCMGALCCVTAAMTTQQNISGNTITAITLLTLLALGGLTALVQGGSFHDASKLPPKYINALMWGQAVAGVISAAAALASSGVQGEQDFSAGEESEYLGTARNTANNSTGGSSMDTTDNTHSTILTQARVYFTAAGCVLFVCFAATSFLNRTEFFKSYCKRETEESKEEEDIDGDNGDSSNLDSLADTETICVPLLPERNGSDLDLESSLSGDTQRENKKERFETYCYRFSVFATFAVTLSVFPAVTSSICARGNVNTNLPCSANNKNRFLGDLWTPSLFLLFNLFDLFGRCAASYFPKKAPKGVTVMTCAISRILIVPFLLACNVVTAPCVDWAFPRIFRNSNFTPIASIALLAFTNGHLSSISMMWGPSTVSLIKKRASEGTLLTLFLTGGLGVGSAFSYALVAALQR